MIASRRQFLVAGLQVTTAVPALGGLGRALVGGGAAPVGRVLVVLQLSGGNDGLNMVVPHRQDAYYRSRPNLSLARSTLHALDDDHGLHPEMSGLAELYSEGSAALVHGVGYPEPNRSHFRSMEIWHTADPEHPPGQHGWMGRLADQISVRRPGTMAAMHMGEGNLPLALYGTEYFTPTVRDEHGFRLETPPEPDGERFTSLREQLLQRPASAGEVAFLREAARGTYRAAERMAKAAEVGSAVDYPDFALARQLQLVARLIAGRFGTRIFHVELSGFDTHARQAPTHAALLSELSQSLTAFQRDLEASGVAERVLTLAFSEFGRRVAENGSRGTDHGAGAPVLLVGGGLRGGMYGTPPDLQQLEQGDLPYETDLRSIYTTIERDWMGLASSSEWEALDFLA